jgi:DNA-binding response OmpR family regulator
MRILVVDDNRDAADTFSQALLLEGHDVRTAYDGEAGLAEAALFDPQVAVLDIGLPRLDGVELARALLLLPGQPVFLIACTGSDDDLTRRRMTDVGFDEIVIKPVSVGVLLATVNSVPNTERR